MTTKNNHLTLIERVGGIEKAKAIVEGATFGTHYRVDTGRIIYCPNENHFFFADQIKLGVEFIRIDDLRTAIAEHNCDHDWEDMSKNGDAERTLICTYCSLTKHDQLSENSGELKAGHRQDHSKDVTDMVTDITNHISPNTKVINHG